VHAIDAANGREIAAFMPRRSMHRLLNQAAPDGDFQYVLDGPISVQDVYNGNEWSQLVVGTGVGVNNGAISGGVQCGQSWARQQYQLTRPPQ
jgi:Tfp pilus tip-associated adhesin PilY1